MGLDDGRGGLRGLLAVAAVVAGVLFLYPLALGIPLLDPDEGLHAAIAQEMVERGDWVVPHFLGAPFLDKPILYFWAEALSLTVLGMHEAAVRLPGLLFGLLGAVTTAVVAWRFFGRTTGLVAGLFYATMILPTALAQAAAHDVALVPWVSLALLLFWESDRAAGWRAGAGFAAAIGLLLALAVLTKGLVGVAIVGLSYGLYLLLTRRLSTAACLRGAAALLVAAGVAAIWYLAVEARNPGYLRYYFLERHLLGYATNTQTHGDAPWWYYLPILLGGGLPWTAYLPATVMGGLKGMPLLIRARRWQALRAWWQLLGRGESRGAMVLLWCWLIGSTLLLSAAHSKLVTYIWPVFPAAAILAAVAWSRLIEGTLGDAARRLLAATLRLSCLTAPALVPVVMLVAQHKFEMQFSWPVGGIAGLVSLAPLPPMFFLAAGRPKSTIAAAALSVACQFAVIMTFIVPHVASTRSARDLAEHFNRRGRLPQQLWFVEERVGSLVFYLQPPLRQRLRDGRIRQVEIWDLPEPDPEAVVILPERRAGRVQEWFDLGGVPYRSAAGYRFYRPADLRDRWIAVRTEAEGLRR